MQKIQENKKKTWKERQRGNESITLLTCRRNTHTHTKRKIQSVKYMCVPFGTFTNTAQIKHFTDKKKKIHQISCGWAEHCQYFSVRIRALYAFNYKHNFFEYEKQCIDHLQCISKNLDTMLGETDEITSISLPFKGQFRQSICILLKDATPICLNALILIT